MREKKYLTNSLEKNDYNTNKEFRKIEKSRQIPMREGNTHRALLPYVKRTTNNIRCILK